MRRLLCLLFAAVPAPLFCLASGADFLRAELPARPAALAGAFVAIHEDPSAFLWNPGALAWLAEPVLGATHFTSIVDTHYEQATLVQPLHIFDTNGGMGVSMQFSRTEDFAEVDLAGNTVGQVENFDLVAMVGYGLKVRPNFSLGLNVKGFGSRLADYEARGFAVDVGAQFKVHRRWSLGFAFNDLGVQEAFIEDSDPLPSILRLGVQGLLFEAPDGRVLGLAEVKRPWTTQDRLTASVGLEYWYQDTLSFRAGFRAGELLGSLTLGLGYQWSGLNLDYAYVPLGVLGVTHRFSMGVKLGTLYERLLPYTRPKRQPRPYSNREEKKPEGKTIRIPSSMR